MLCVVDPGGSEAGDEVVLPGGSTHARIVRIGDTVRRPASEWSPSVHRLLLHLEAVGFDGAPRFLGLDGEGREVLTYVAGAVVHPDRSALIETDDALRRVGSWLRRYHDAVATFDFVGEHHWCDSGADPSGSHEVLCHNDLAPWNLVEGPRGWVFIDWDLAAPGRRSWDLAYVLQTLVPLWPDRERSAETVARRVGVLCAGYGMPELASTCLDVAVERCTTMYELIRRRAAIGEPHFAQLLADGHDVIWEAGARHTAANVAGWKRLLASH